MSKPLSALAHLLTLVVWLFAAFRNAGCQTTNANGPNNRTSHTAVSCTKDSQCPSGQRCGFTGGCESKGRCVVPSNDSHCIDPGGRCSCDGRPVHIFCAAGSRTEFTSAPVNAVGPCPRPCTAESGSDRRVWCVRRASASSGKPTCTTPRRLPREKVGCQESRRRSMRFQWLTYDHGAIVRLTRPRTLIEWTSPSMPHFFSTATVSEM